VDTPDEVEAIVTVLEAFNPSALIKRLLPGAEILDVLRVTWRRRIDEAFFLFERAECPIKLRLRSE
jgi:hypothetical protein